MAEFQIALENTLRFEDSTLSGTVTYDSGGTTRFGIAEQSHPEVYPEMEECSRDRALEIAGNVLRGYWFFDGVESQLVANKLFDMAVNMGTHEAVLLAQKSCGTDQDGKWGPATEASVNAMPAEQLMVGLRQNAEKFYANLAYANPEKYNRYLRGWLKRASA